MTRNRLPLIKLGGSPYEIGYLHGKEGREGIKDFLDQVILHGKEFSPGLTKGKAVSQVRLYLPFIEAYAPHLTEEIKGIADGASIPVEEAYVLQMRAELTQLTLEEADGCTSFALPKEKTKDNKVWVGQNLDLSPFYKHFGVMLHITPEKGPAILCYSQIGSLAHAGINSAGIGWAANALFSSGWKPGVPRPVLYRLLLEKEDLSAALRVVTDAKRASSCNYLVAHASGEIKNLEAIPDHYGIVDSRGDLFIHANHFTHPEMVPFEKRPKDKLENSKFRENRLRELMTQNDGKISIDQLKVFLADHQLYPTAVCTHPEGNPWNMATIASIIAKPADRVMHVSMGPGCANEYVSYTL